MIWHRNLLLVYAGILAVIILIKFILWVNADYPIGRLSILYLLSLIAVLSFRNKVTFVLLWVLSIAPFAWRIIEHHVSGSTPLEYTYAFYKYFIEDHQAIALFFRQFPYYFGALLCLTTLFKRVRLLYGIPKKE